MHTVYYVTGKCRLLPLKSLQSLFTIDVMMLKSTQVQFWETKHFIVQSSRMGMSRRTRTKEVYEMEATDRMKGGNTNFEVS